ncbi:MAG: spore maturation protein [Clostridia bacterium]|nr:spore maturation protein [Clostridia bacterium]
MISVSDYIVPIIFFTVLLLSVIKKKDAYNGFIDGSKNAISLMCNVFPYLVTVMIAIQLFKASGIANRLSFTLAPIFKFIGIPSELTELMIIRPVSGAGAMAVLENIFVTYGPDSFIGKCASVIYGSSETVFYISAVYFSGVDGKAKGYAIPVALVCTFIGYIIGCALL